MKKFIAFVRRLLPKAVGDSLRSYYTPVRSKVRTMRRSMMKKISTKSLMDDLTAGGIGEGDRIMVHSAMSAIGNIEGGADAIIQSLLNSVTPGGTVMMPTYGSAAFVEDEMSAGRSIDLRNIRSQMGKITEVFRSWPDVIRSSHPFSAVCAWGDQSEHIISHHHTHPYICHNESPMGRIIDFNAKIVGIGVTIAVGMAVSHYLEDTDPEFPVEVHAPPFVVKYTDASGQTVEREVVRYDPAVTKDRIGSPNTEWICDRLTEHFSRMGIFKTFKFGNANAWVMEAQPVLVELKRLASKGITIYLTKEKWKTMNQGDESIASW